MPRSIVSVIVATNRGGPYLAEALASVTDQTWPSWELVVVDDGSPEPDEIDRLVSAIPRARVVHQENAGLAVARNVGISITSGEYLVFLDDDDLWERDRLEQLVAALEQAPDAVACHSQYGVIDASGDPIDGGHATDVGAATLFELLRNEKWAWIGSLMVRRDAISRAGGFHSLLPPSEDSDLIWRLAWLGPIVYVPKLLVHSRHHPAAVTRQVAIIGRAALQTHQIQVWGAERRRNDPARRAALAGVRAEKRYWAARVVQHAASLARTDRRRAITEVRIALRTFPISFCIAIPRVAVGTLRARRHTPGADER
jgi:glycosyltransferase involved in cell wall biosynthesis